MELAIIKNNTEYNILPDIAERLGWAVTVNARYGSPYYPIVAVGASRVYFVSGANAKSKIENYLGQGAREVTALQLIKYLIINSPLRNK